MAPLRQVRLPAKFRGLLAAMAPATPSGVAQYGSTHDASCARRPVAAAAAAAGGACRAGSTDSHHRDDDGHMLERRGPRAPRLVQRGAAGPRPPSLGPEAGGRAAAGAALGRRRDQARRRQGAARRQRKTLEGEIGPRARVAPDSRRPLPASPSRQALTLKDAWSSGCGRVFSLDLGGGGERIFYPRVGMAETADADTGAVVGRKKT